jgi:hypothetical protein
VSAARLHGWALPSRACARRNLTRKAYVQNLRCPFNGGWRQRRPLPTGKGAKGCGEAAARAPKAAAGGGHVTLGCQPKVRAVEGSGGQTDFQVLHVGRKATRPRETYGRDDAKLRDTLAFGSYHTEEHCSAVGAP